MVRSFFSLLFLSLALQISGQTSEIFPPRVPKRQIQAVQTAENIRIDGHLNEGAWLTPIAR